MASGLPLRQAVEPLAFEAEGVAIPKFRQQVTIDVVVHTGGGESGATLDADVGDATAHDVVDGSKLQLIVGEDGAASTMATGIDGIVVGRVSSRRTAGHAGGGGGDPNGIDGAIRRSYGDVVVHGDVLHGVLEEHMSGNIDAEVAVKGVVVNRAAGDCPAILAPKVDAIVVIGIRRGIPIGEIMEMIVMYIITASLTDRAGGDTVIYVVNVGVRESEVVPVTRNGPGRIMAGEIIYRHKICQMPVDTVNRVCRPQIRG